MIINMTSCIGFIVMGFLGCDNPQWAGALALDKWVFKIILYHFLPPVFIWWNVLQPQRDVRVQHRLQLRRVRLQTCLRSRRRQLLLALLRWLHRRNEDGRWWPAGKHLTYTYWSASYFSNMEFCQEYSGCSCIEGGEATEGLCKRSCSTLIPYLVVMSISKFAASMTFVPYMTVLMRSVEPRDKSLSLGLSSFIMMIACEFWRNSSCIMT